MWLIADLAFYWLDRLLPPWHPDDRYLWQEYEE